MSTIAKNEYRSYIFDGVFKEYSIYKFEGSYIKFAGKLNIIHKLMTSIQSLKENESNSKAGDYNKNLQHPNLQLSKRIRKTRHKHIPHAGTQTL